MINCRKKKRERYEQGNVWRLFNGLQTSAHETSVMYNEMILCFCKIRFRVDFIDLHWALRVFEDPLGFMERVKKIIRGHEITIRIDRPKRLKNT